MGWLERWALRRVAKASGVSAGTLVTLINGGTRLTRRRLSTSGLLEAWETSPWFRGVIERVSFAAAVVPWRLYSVKPARGSREFKEGTSFVRHTALQCGESLEVRTKILRELDDADRLVEITDHKLFDVLARPNPSLTGVDTRLLTFASITVAGEIGWALARNKLGAPEQIWPVPPHWITRTPSPDHDFYDVQINGQVQTFSPQEFILFRNPTLANPYNRGSGLGASLADELETDEYIAKFQSSWFVNRGKPDIIFTVKPVAGGGEVDPKELEIAKEEFENQYRDVRRGGRSFWTRGDIDVKELSHKFVDLDLTEQRTWIKDLVRQVIGCPPEVMGDVTSSNRATIQEALAILAMLSTVPQLERMRAQLQAHLIPMYDPRLVLDYHSPVPEDRAFKLQAIQAAPYTVEVGEMRRLQGLEDRGEADRVHYLPMNLIPVPAPPRAKPERAVRALTSVHTKDADAAADAVVIALQPHRFEEELGPEIEETVRRWGNATLRELGASMSFNMVNPLVLEHMRRFTGEKIAGINDTTRKLVREALRQGIANGEGAVDLARRLEALMEGMARVRALTIARTEVTQSANFGIWGAHRMSGLVERRQWIATPDDRTRDAHAELNGQIVGINEGFSVNGLTAMYPGGFGIAELDIQCRCATRALVDDKGFDSATVWRAFIAETDKDEDRVARACRRAFDAQLADMLAALRRAA